MLKPTQKIKEIEMTDVTKEVLEIAKSENLEVLNKYLYSKFSEYEFKQREGADEHFQKFVLPSGYEFEMNTEFAKKVLLGTFEIDLAGDGNNKKQALRLDTLPKYVKHLIVFYRDKLPALKDLPKEETNGFNCLQDFLILWLKEHYYFTEVFLEDQTRYTLM